MDLVSKKYVSSFPQSSFNWEQFCTLCSLYDRFICQFGFMEPIKQTVENDLDFSDCRYYLGPCSALPSEEMYSIR